MVRITDHPDMTSALFTVDVKQEIKQNYVDMQYGCKTHRQNLKSNFYFDISNIRALWHCFGDLFS